MKPTSSSHSSNPVRTTILIAIFALLCISSTVFVITVQTSAFAQGNVATANSNIASQRPKEPTSVVSGRVRYEDTDRPVRRAKILLLNATPGKSGGQYSGVTNLRGEFRIEHVGEGTYIVVVDSPGVLYAVSLLDTRELGHGREPNLTDMLKETDNVTVNGITNAEINIHARRGGTIAGRVTYSDGDPAVNCLVGVSRKTDGKFSRTISNSATAGFGFTTDDRGIYRITNLPPGDYVVTATELNTRDSGREWEPQGITALRHALAFTYYPSETNSKSATEINLTAGQEIKSIDITLSDRGEHMISGSVISRADRLPVKNAKVGITLLDKASMLEMGMPAVTVQTDEQGLWSLDDIPSGEYSISVQPGSEPEIIDTAESPSSSDGGVRRPQNPLRRLVPATEHLKVEAEDVTGLVIELGQSAKINGKVSVEGDKVRPAILDVSVTNGDADSYPEGYNPYEFGRVNELGNFEVISVKPGQNNIDLKFEPESGWYVKRIMIGGKDVKGQPLTIAEGQQLTGVEIVISPDSAQAVIHVINTLNHTPVSGVQVCLVPSAPAAWGNTNGYLCGVSDSAGTFQISGAPGTYLALIPAPGESSNKITPEYVRLHAAAAQSFVLKAGAENQVQLSISR